MSRHSTARSATALVVRTDDGFALQATVTDPGDDAVRHVAVLCHPHPRHGGTMHAPVMETLTDRICNTGVAVVRGNFRGVGRSEGSWGGGVEEVRDVRALVDAARTRYPSAHVTVGGWSFGGGVSLRALADDPGDGHDWFGVAPALSFAGDPTPCPPRRGFVVTGSRDRIVPAADVTAWAERCDGDLTSVVLDGCDHFFVGRFAVQAGEVLADWISGRPG